MTDVKNILLVGVGGQGIILASKILAQGLIDAGYDVKMSEVHGMAQRGGSVTTQIRYGSDVHSPIIGKGQADIIVAFEKMECLRWIDYLKKEGKVVVNDYEIPSAPILAGKAKYPEKIIDVLKEKTDVAIIEAADIAKDELGNIKSLNIIMLGALIKALKIDDINANWEEIIKNNVKSEHADLNIQAFQKGMEQIK